jgi:DNA-binding NtrC family response regulator
VLTSASFEKDFRRAHSDGGVHLNQSGVEAARANPVAPPLGNEEAVLVVAGAAIDDRGLRQALGRAGLTVARATDAAAGLRALAERPFVAAVADLCEGRAAIGWIRLVRMQQPRVAVIALADPAESALAGEALDSGADIIAKPIDGRAIALAVANLRDRHSAHVPDGAALTNVWGTPVFAQSPAMRLAMDVLHAHAPDRVGTVMVGEAGTGRRMLAYLLHRLHHGADGHPFVEVNAERVSPPELERRLFGEAPERRSTDGSVDMERVSAHSAVAQARGGTLFFRNLEQAPNRIQARLARLFRDREVVILGSGNAPVELDVRAIASLNGSTNAHGTNDHIRTDLYDYLSHARIEVPPLRSRREDIPLIAAHLVRIASARERVPAKSFSRSALALIAALPWPGNAIELGALIDVLVTSVPRDVIELDDVLERAALDGVTTRVDAGMTLREARARFERECISAVLVRHQGRVGEAAKALGIQRTNLYRKVRQLKVARSLLATRK